MTDDGNAGPNISPYEKLVELAKQLSVVELANLSRVVDKLLEAELGVKAVVATDVRTLTDEDFLALRWLNGNEKAPQRGRSPGQAATVRIVRGFNHPVLDTLASALEDVGSSEMKFRLQHRGPGRPPRGPRLARDRLKLGAAAETEIARREALAEAQGCRKPKRNAETLAAAEQAGKKLSAGYEARATFLRAKARRNNSPK
jgi:hypothetical protein